MPLRSKYEDQLKNALSHIEEREIELVVGERGFTEKVAGIESFCPWSSVLGYYDYENTIFVELKNTLWAIIPKDSLDGSSDDINVFIEVLEKNGIKKKQNKPIQPTR
ncbi:MAG: YcxB family protein [Candidatus Competibacteraceae bacterium]|nr:YcxB family protein [Candidatus Competibacteraceae bacterium]